MCGRYIYYDGKNQRLKKLIETARNQLDEQKFRQISLGDVFPGDHAFVGMADQNGLHTHVLQWGYASKHGLVINARSETVFTTRFFAGGIPCAAIASAYYEWSSEHERYRFFIPGKTLYLASIAHREKDGMHYAVLTEEAAGKCRNIHSRQPVIFDYESAEQWCLSKNPGALLKNSLHNRSFEKD